MSTTRCRQSAREKFIRETEEYLNKHLGNSRKAVQSMVSENRLRPPAHIDKRLAQRQGKVRVGIVGVSGSNSQQRVVPEMLRFPDELYIIGYDKKAPPEEHPDVQFERVSGNAELAEKIRRDRLDFAIIETPCSNHPSHVKLAIRSGVPAVICEKMLAERLEDAEQFVPELEQLRGQTVRFIDHYLLLDSIKTLARNSDDWLGEIRSMQVVLFEKKGVSRHEVRSHRAGMGNFAHHGLAVASLLGVRLDELTATEASAARHADADVPDTYRSARYTNGRGNQPVLEVAVGKYMAHPRKELVIEGERGTAFVDRDQGFVWVSTDDGDLVIEHEKDTGYRSLARALADGALPANLLSGRACLQIIRLLDAAHQGAEWLDFYPDGQQITWGAEAPA